MKTRTLFVLLITVLATTALVYAQTSTAPPATPPAHMHGGMAMHQSGDKPMDCAAMMKEHEQMQAQMKAADEKLQKLVAAMNAASGSKKTDATAAVVAELVAQHQAMHQHMEQMMPEMMQHMMGHMQSGMTGAMNCPMMKGGAEAQAQHQH